MSCPKPKDTARIAANRKHFYHQKEKDRDAAKVTKDTSKTPKAVPFAWRLPEPHKTNKIVIHWHPRTYNPARPDWDVDDTPPSELAASKLQPPPSPADDDRTIQTTNESTISKVQLQTATLNRVVHNNLSMASHAIEFHSLQIHLYFTQFFI